MMVKFRPLRDDFELPAPRFDGDPCYGLRATRIEHAGTRVTCALGFCAEIPAGYKGMIVPTDRLTESDWVMQNASCVVPSTYRGEWKVEFKYVGRKESGLRDDFPFKAGDVVAQVYFDQALRVHLAVDYGVFCADLAKDDFPQQ